MRKSVLKRANDWFYATDFDTCERLTGYCYTEFSEEDGYQEYVDFVNGWWENLTDKEKVKIYLSENY